MGNQEIDSKLNRIFENNHFGYGTYNKDVIIPEIKELIKKETEVDKTTVLKLSEENKKEQLQEVWNFLSKKGLSLSDKLKIRGVFEKEGVRKFHNRIRQARGSKYFESEKIKGFLFSTEDEAKFIEALQEFSPETNTEILLQVFGIVSKLLNKNTEWEFNRK